MVKQLKLDKVLEELGEDLQKEWFLASLTSTGNVMIVFEGEDSKQAKFTGRTIHEAIRTAEEYIEHERTMGMLPKSKEPKTEPKLGLESELEPKPRLAPVSESESRIKIQVVEG